MARAADRQCGVADRLLAQLDTLKGPTLGYRVDRYEHSLQTASRALREGARTDMVVAALFHDIGDALAPANHSELAAAILAPYVDDETTWVVRHHGVFQGYHYWHKIGFVLQGNVIASGGFASSQYLEVESRLDEPVITPWPMYSKNLDS